MTKNKFILLFLCLILLLIASFFLALSYGNAQIPLDSIVDIVINHLVYGIKSNDKNGALYDIIWLLRMPRIVLAICVGAGLSVCGVVMQAIVKNPLADPYILGISSGASLGATAAVLLGIGSTLDEGFLADQLDVTRKVLYDAFISLAKRKIIRYVPGDVKPYIVYYQPRLPLSYITLGREAYENRKELFVTKIGAMARYIRDDETCRQLLLMEYFGQKEEKPCGICDVCIGKKKRLHREERKSLEEQILQVLAKQNTNIRELVRQLGEDEEVVIGQVRKLLDEGKIQYVSTLELGITRKS